MFLSRSVYSSFDKRKCLIVWFGNQYSVCIYIYVIILQVHFRYPQKSLIGKAIKSAIATHLASPVLMFGDHVYAFRVIWRVHDDILAQVWDAIVSCRHLCDQVVAKTPSLQMFVSCISGVFTNAVVAGTAGKETREKPVYPAVSYWVVLDEAAVSSYGDLLSRITAVCPSAQVKRIVDRCSQTEEAIGVDCGKLFVTLKDHNSGFVNNKINRSLLAAGTANIDPQPTNAKLVLMPLSKYCQHIPAAVEATKASGLCIDLQLVEENVVIPGVSHR